MLRYFVRRRTRKRHSVLYRKKDRTLYRRMIIEASITEEERVWIKKWADGEEIKMPRAYADLIRCAMKNLGIDKESVKG